MMKLHVFYVVHLLLQVRINKRIKELTTSKTLPIFFPEFLSCHRESKTNDKELCSRQIESIRAGMDLDVREKGAMFQDRGFRI